MEIFSAFRALGLFMVMTPAQPLLSNRTSAEAASVDLDILCTSNKTITAKEDFGQIESA